MPARLSFCLGPSLPICSIFCHFCPNQVCTKSRSILCRVLSCTRGCRKLDISGDVSGFSYGWVLPISFLFSPHKLCLGGVWGLQTFVWVFWMFGQRCRLQVLGLTNNVNPHMWHQGITTALVRARCREGGRTACGLSVQWCGLMNPCPLLVLGGRESPVFLSSILEKGTTTSQDTWVRCGHSNGANSLRKENISQKVSGQNSPCFFLKRTFPVTLCSVQQGCDVQPCCVSEYSLIGKVWEYVWSPSLRDVRWC